MTPEMQHLVQHEPFAILSVPYRRHSGKKGNINKCVHGDSATSGLVQKTLLSHKNPLLGWFHFQLAACYHHFYLLHHQMK